MKAVIVEEPGRITIREIEEPQFGEYEVLLRMKACAICSATDMNIIEGRFPDVKKYPVILGHEGVGEVVKTGKKVRSFKLGDFVLEPFAGKRSDGIGSAYGNFAEYAVAHDFAVMSKDGKNPPEYLKRQQLVPGDIDPKEATILTTLKETLSGLLNLGFKKDMSLVIFGDGPVGCALAKFAKLLGARFVIGIGHWDERLKKMKYLGADYVVNEKKADLKDGLYKILKDEKVDMVIDAVGKNRIMNEGLSLIREGGKVGIYGVITEPKVDIEVSKWPNNASIQMLYFPAGHPEMHERVIEYVRSGIIRFRDFYSHIIKIDQIEEGIKLIRNRSAFKVIVEIG